MIKKKRKLSLDIGQLLIIGFDGTEMSPELAEMLTRLQPAGVILFGRNIVEATQTYKLLKDCQACVSSPLFTSVDLEGGRVDRFREVFGRAPSAADVYATGRRTLFRKHGKLIGDCCRALGFNTDFAPVVDLALEASRTVMSSRAVSADPKQVVIYAREFLVGLRSSGLLGAIKHFPGLGGANLDTHHELPSVGRSYKQMWDEDIYPYRTLRKDAPMMVVGHANYPQITRDPSPASLSKKWITDVLRKKVGYRGLIVSDDLEMGGVLKAAPIEIAAEQFIRAGGDLCLVCHQADYVNRCFDRLVSEAGRDLRFARRVHESLNKIRLFKRKEPAFIRKRSAMPSQEKIQALSRRLWEFSEQVRLIGIAKDNSKQRSSNQ
jgi:beta-N-acetylhexosaminidase